MTLVNLGPIDYHEHLLFVWTAARRGGLAAAFVVDGRNYADEEQTRAAIREVLEQTDSRVRVEDYSPASINPANERELDYWPSWAEFRTFLDVYGPVYPWRRPSPTEQARNAAGDQTATSITGEVPSPSAQLPPLYDNLHFECWGQLVELFPRGGRRYDPVLGYEVPGFGLNGYTGEFEGHTKRVLQLVSGEEDDETWPLRDEEEFIAHVEQEREQLLRTSFFQRHDKPEIFAAYEQAAREGRTPKSLRATYEMWRQIQRRRAHFILGDEPVRVDLADDGTPVMAWRLETATGRIVATSRADAEAVFAGDGTRVTEYAWMLAVEERRIALDLGVDGAIAEEYSKASTETDDVYRRAILTKSFDLWAEKFAAEDGT